MRKWVRKWVTWVRFSFLEGHLSKTGYRRLQKEQVREATDASRRLLHDVADLVLELQAVTDHVENALIETNHDD